MPALPPHYEAPSGLRALTWAVAASLVVHAVVLFAPQKEPPPLLSASSRFEASLSARPQAEGVCGYWQQAGLPAAALHIVDAPFDAALAALADDPQVACFACDADLAAALRRRLSLRPGAIVPVVTGDPAWALWRLAAEQTLTINTAAAGGNAALLAGA